MPLQRPTRQQPAAFRPSWLCPTEPEWLRYLDLERRIGPMRTVVLLVLLAPGILVAAFTGPLGWLSAVGAVLVHFAVTVWVLYRPPSVLTGIGTVTSFQVLLLVVVGVTGGVGSPCLPWLAVPATILATRYRARVVAVGVGITVAAATAVCALQNAFGTPYVYPAWLHLLCLAGLTAACGATSIALSGAEVDSRRAADLDPLTGLLNRASLPRHLDRLVEDSLAVARTSAVLLLDVDHFKRVNDEHGHPRGDGVLRGVAGRLADEARPDDKLFRFGGEEFLVLVPNVSLETAVAVAERLRGAVAAWPVHGLPVTVSVGVALTGPGRETGDELLAAADAALYAAKRSGRNRVWSAPDDPDIPVQRVAG